MEIEQQLKRKRSNLQGQLQQMKQILHQDQKKIETHKEPQYPTFGPYNKKIKFRFSNINDNPSMLNENPVPQCQKQKHYFQEKNSVQKKYIPLESIEIEEDDKENIENYFMINEEPKIKTQSNQNQEGNSIFRNLILQIHDQQYRKN